MKKAILLFSFIFLMFSVSTFAQNETEKQDPIEILLNADAQRNLDIAWQYFKLKKAYKAALGRMEETIAAHPTFSKMDEVLYVAGMSSYKLANDKGNQKRILTSYSEEEREKYSPERLRESAIGYLGTLVEEYPDSKYAKKAKKTLKELKPKEKDK